MKTNDLHRAPTDWRLCFVADSEAAADMDVLALIERAAAGGATLVQLRGKAWTDRQFLELARQSRRRLRPAGIPLIINDRADIARAAGAAGVHVGRADLPVAAAREILGRRSIIGLSVGSPAEARAGEAAGADYLGVGPVFLTRSKENAGVPLGVAAIRKIRSVSSLPILAIGGISAENAPAVIRAGADGVAVISAMTAAGDPEHEAAKIIESIGTLGIRRRPTARGGGRS
jgi:thiamine-phosphate pyrophosphorylase